MPIHPRLKNAQPADLNETTIYMGVLFVLYLTRFVNVLSVSIFKYVWVDNTSTSTRRRMKTHAGTIEAPDKCDHFLHSVCERPATSTIRKYKFYMIQRGRGRGADASPYKKTGILDALV